MSTCLFCTQKENHNPCPCTVVVHGGVEPFEYERIMMKCKTCNKDIHYDKCKTIYHEDGEAIRNDKFITSECFYCRGETGKCGAREYVYSPEDECVIF